MEPRDPPSSSLRLDAELLGHDPALASTVETLRKPRSGGEADGPASNRNAAPVSEPAPVSPRLPPPVVAPVQRPPRPSGFFFRGLPVGGLLPARLPWRSIGILALVCTLGASGVAWGMVLLLRPAAFSKGAAQPAPRAETMAVLSRAEHSTAISPALTRASASASSAVESVLLAPGATLALRHSAESPRPAKSSARNVDATPGAAADVAATGKRDARKATPAVSPAKPLEAPATTSKKAWFE